MHPVMYIYIYIILAPGCFFISRTALEKQVSSISFISGLPGNEVKYNYTTLHHLLSLPSLQSYLVCPYCYNEPPFKAVQKGMSCSVCPHESCPQAKPQHRVERCSECDNGVLVLEPHWQTGGTPKWKISCNNSK